MEQNPKRYLITTALPYANGPLHIGHLAGVYVPADIYVRYLRLQGREVCFVGGSDEHGVPITIKALKEGVKPQDIVDRYHKIIKESMRGLGISYDIYSRTTSDIHHQTASDFFRKLLDEGKFIVKESEQFYDPGLGQFLADRYIVGTCPKCGAPGAYGDQCEKCGSTLSPDELIDPHSSISGAVPEKRKTKHWYLPLDQYEGWLREWILEGHKEWKTNVYGQCKSWLDGGLQARAVSRDLNWGIPVPIEGETGKVLYVWFDAPIGYISNTIELHPSSWKTWWQDPETKLVHFIGKDNIVFHCIVFPSMLKAHGDFILPENVPANEFLNLEGRKISTSRNWAVWLHEYLQEFPGKEDVLRYVLCATTPETKDNDFTWADFQARNNNELVAVFGNFVNRALVLTHKYFGGKVPACGPLTEADEAVLAQVPRLKAAIEEALEHYRFRDAVREAMNLARLGNKYLADTEPWKLYKTDPARVATILHLALQLCAQLTIAFEPFTPFATARLRKMLGMDALACEGRLTSDTSVDGVERDKSWAWSVLGTCDLLPEGLALGEVSLLFEKVEDEAVAAQVAKLQATLEANEAAEAAEAARNARPEPQKEACAFEDFEKMDIRTATVLEAQRVPKTDKLLKLTIDTGLDTRTIVSGIAEHYSPEEMVGKQICILANLAPRKIRGIESKGMILMAKDPAGKMRFVTPQEAVGNGATIG